MDQTRTSFYRGFNIGTNNSPDIIDGQILFDLKDSTLKIDIKKDDNKKSRKTINAESCTYAACIGNATNNYNYDKIETIKNNVNSISNSIGKYSDAANADGSIYARIKKNVSDLDELEDRIIYISNLIAGDPTNSINARINRNTSDLQNLRNEIGAATNAVEDKSIYTRLSNLEKSSSSFNTLQDQVSSLINIGKTTPTDDYCKIWIDTNTNNGYGLLKYKNSNGWQTISAIYTS